MPTKNMTEVRAARRGTMTDSEKARADAAGALLSATLRLGITVRDARDKAGLTQTELANRLGVAQSAVSRIEAGRTNPSVRTLVAIAAALAFPLIVAFGDERAVLWKEVKE